MSLVEPPPIIAHSSPLNVIIPVLGVDETRCRRLFARNLERASAGLTLDCAGDHGRRAVLLSGWACELRFLLDGRRQIFSFLVPGDLIQIPPRGREGMRSTVALTRLESINVDVLLQDQRKIGRTDLVSGLQELKARQDDRLLNHIVRLGRLSAYERVLHLLLELHERLGAVGLVQSNSFRVPLTQDHLADSLGLSLVHIHRTLKQLKSDGLVDIKAGLVTLQRPERLRRLADYEPQERRGPPADHVKPRASYA